MRSKTLCACWGLAMTEGLELRTGIVRAMESSVVDLIAGRYGDPHVGFLVLVHPDREPTIVALTPAGAHSFDHIRVGKSSEHAEPGERFFTSEDLQEASRALPAAQLAIVCGMDDIAGYVRCARQRLLDSLARDTLERAARDARLTARCEHCGRKFTPRGLPNHQARSSSCKRRRATSGGAR